MKQLLRGWVRVACMAWAILSGLGLRGVAATEPFAGVDDKWRHYQSPHFELYTRVNDGDSRTLLHELEVLRAITLGTLKLESRTPVPVTIFHFRDDRDFRAYFPPELRKNDIYRAYYRTDPDRGVMLLAPLDSDRRGNQLALSSYIAHLFTMAGERPPPWFQHGFGDLFETIEVGSDDVTVGRPSPGTVQYLQRERFLPLESLLGIEQDNPLFKDEGRSRLFFAQAWAVVHYWLLGKHDDLPRERVYAFLTYVRQHREAGGEELRQAFEATFGMTFAEMNRRIDSYVSGGRYMAARLPLPEVAAPKSYARRDVSRDEIRLRLGEVAFRTNRDPAGKFALLESLGRGSADIRSLEALGAMALRDGNQGEARERWNAAFDAGSQNPALIRLLAEFETKPWFRQVDYHFRLSDETAARLRTLLKRSIECAPQQAGAYEQLAWVESAAPKPEIASVNLVQGKFATLDDRPRTLLALALVRLRLGDRATGERLLTNVEEMEPPLSVLQSVERVRAILENRPPRRIEGAEEARSRAVRVPRGLHKPE